MATEQDHSGLAAKRVVCAVTGGLAAAVVALLAGASWSVAALCASEVAALVFVVWVWSTSRARTQPKRPASREQPDYVAITVSSVASLLGR